MLTKNLCVAVQATGVVVQLETEQLELMALEVELDELIAQVPTLEIMV
jgi:hypothetical protein